MEFLRSIKVKILKDHFYDVSNSRWTERVHSALPIDATAKVNTHTDTRLVWFEVQSTINIEVMHSAFDQCQHTVRRSLLLFMYALYRVHTVQLSVVTNLTTFLLTTICSIRIRMLMSENLDFHTISPCVCRCVRVWRVSRSIFIAIFCAFRICKFRGDR